MGGGDDIAARILESLKEKPRSISEIARELDEEKYEISKKIDVLVERGDINTYRIGRSTACMLADQALDESEDGDETGTPADNASTEDRQEPVATVGKDGDRPRSRPMQPEPAPEPPGEPEQPSRPTPPGMSSGDEQSSEERQPERTQQDVEDWFEQAWEASGEGRRPAATGHDTAAESVERSQQAVSRGDTGRPQNRSDRQQRAQAGAQPGKRGSGPRTIGIVSGKGGVGKTVVTLNLGAALMDLGEDVIVMDADAEMPNVGLHLGMYTSPTSLKEVVEQDVHIMSAMHVDKDSGLRVIPTALSREPVTDHVREAIRMIPDEYIVLIDSPPGYERPLDRVIDTCDELVFVTTPEIPSVTDTFKLVEEARQRGKEILGVVINMYSSPKKHLSVAEVEKSLEIPVLGVINQSKTVQKSIFDTQPAVSMDPYAKPSRSFKQVAAGIVGRTYEPSLVDRIKGLIP